jgi:hypothetical protein
MTHNRCKRSRFCARWLDDVSQNAFRVTLSPKGDEGVKK